MQIANFKEYVSVIRELCTFSSVDELEKYEKELGSSSVKRNKERKKIEIELGNVKTQILELRIKIKETKNIDEKKELSAQIKKYNSLKEDVVKKYNEITSITRFSVLNKDTKVAICSSFLLRKYLTQEIIKNNPLGFNKGNKGNIIVDIDKLKNSNLYQEASHIRDFVGSYISKYPERVKGANYFKGMLKDIKNLDELSKEVNIYFEKWLEEDKKNSTKEDKILQSRQGIEVLRLYPEDSLQAVKLTTKEALKYEGKEMGHCVGGGSYDSKVENGVISIYSIRDYNDNGELEPHTTMRYEGGKIAEIKGKANKAVRAKYVNATRDFVMQICGYKTLDELMYSKNIPATELANIGFMKDKSGKVHDVFNLIESNTFFEEVFLHCEDLGEYNLGKMNVGTLNLMGEINNKVITNINKLNNIDAVKFVKSKSELPCLDFSAYSKLKFIDLTDINLENVVDIKFPKSIEKISIKSVKIKDNMLSNLKQLSDLNELIINECEFFGSNTDNQLVNNLPKLKKLTSLKLYKCKFAENTHLTIPSSLKNLSLDGNANLDICSVFNDIDNCNKMKSINIKNHDLKNVSMIKLGSDVEEIILSDVDKFALKVIDVSECSNLNKIDLKNKNYKQEIINNLIQDVGYDVISKDESKVKEIVIKANEIEKEKFPNTLERIILPKKLNSTKLTLESLNLAKCENLDEVLYSNKLDIIAFSNLEFEDEIVNFDKCFSSKDIVIDKRVFIPGARVSTSKEIAFDFCHFKNAKDIKFPKDVEELKLAAFFDELKILDLSPYNNLKNIDLFGFGAANMDKIVLPPNLEHFDFEEPRRFGVKELDFSNCKKFDKLSVFMFSILCKDVETIKLPPNIKSVKVDGIEKTKAKIILHSNTPKDMIKLLKEEYKDRVLVAEPENVKITSKIPLRMLKPGNVNG